MDPAYYTNSSLAIASMVIAGGLLLTAIWLLWDMDRTYRHWHELL